MEHDPRAGQGEPLAFAAAGEQHRGAAGRLADAVRADRAGQHLHRVVDRERRGHVAAWRIDVKVNVLAGGSRSANRAAFITTSLALPVVNLALEKHDAVFQQQIAQCELPLPLVILIRIRIVDRKWHIQAHAP